MEYPLSNNEYLILQLNFPIQSFRTLMDLPSLPYSTLIITLGSHYTFAQYKT